MFVCFVYDVLRGVVWLAFLCVFVCVMCVCVCGALCCLMSLCGLSVMYRVMLCGVFVCACVCMRFVV